MQYLAFARRRNASQHCSRCLLCRLLGAQSQPAADLIIRNAKVWTVDKNHPTAQAVAVLGDRIVAVGSNADVEAWHGPTPA